MRQEHANACQREIDRLQTANQSNMDEGVQILELASNAQKLFERQEPRQKGGCSTFYYRTALGRMARSSRLSGNRLISC
jgi:hypothetical protein